MVKKLDMKRIFIIALLVLQFSSLAMGQVYQVSSPDGQTDITINNEKGISWSVKKNGKTVLSKVNIDLKLGDGTSVAGRARSHKINHVSEIIRLPVPLKNAELENNYNEMTIKLQGGYGIHFRVYNEGVAYRFFGTKNKEIIVEHEKLEVVFPKETLSLFPEEEAMYSHYERLYLPKKVESIGPSTFGSLPMFFQETNGMNILFSEADVYDYPNLFLEGSGGEQMKAIFPKFVLETKPNPNRADRSEIISQEADYIAKTNSDRAFPWRFFVISDDDRTFLEQDMVMKLSRSQVIEDASWVKPGKVAWDWWNANNVYGVDFKSGINNQTYKYYIDFASEYGLEYVILDEGWTKSTTEILDYAPDIDVEELVAYGREKGVEIILWCLWKPLDANMDKILDTYASWGVKGIKVDFMQRADQYMVNSFEEIAKKCADRKLLVDFHGAFKPSGLRKAYPNVISYEGVRGNEHNKWADYLTPDHNTTLPFIRMAVGPMDYTPGAMHNTQKENHWISFDRPMSLGTRTHQVSMYVVYESALQMLCDTPSAYLEDDKTARFISQIPTTWDETRALKAKVGDYVLIARRKGDTWYIGGMNDWEERNLPVDLSFLASGEYVAHIFMDGINANTYAEDYKIISQNVNSESELEAGMAKGGGWVAIIKPLK